MKFSGLDKMPMSQQSKGPTSKELENGEFKDKICGICVLFWNLNIYS